jgi:hypothetical protein
MVMPMVRLDFVIASIPYCREPPARLGGFAGGSACQAFALLVQRDDD